MSGMNLARYVCSHCGRKFEAEQKENLECPGCFWSTSVKREEDLKEEVAKPAQGEPSPRRKAISIPWRSLVFVVGAAALLMILGSVIVPHLKKDNRVATLLPSISKSEVVKNEKSSSLDVTGGVSGLAPQERSLLYDRLQLTADRPASDEEKQILERRTPFHTGMIERLPSKAWTLEGYKQLIAEQERLYKVPLPGSYKSKLEKLFKEKYLAGQEAFKADDNITARNLWVESLAFPIYTNNVARHRGVVLTMLRSYINDTLSKIGAINGTLVEKSIRENEAQVSEAYGELLKLIQNKSWQEASATILTISQKLDALENPAATAAPAPPYPAAISQVDEGIQMTLVELLKPPPPSVADLTGLRQDIEAKRKVIESFLAPNLAAAQAHYDAGLDAIHQRKWRDAEKELRQVDLPLALAQDAQKKIEILKKLNETTEKS